MWWKISAGLIIVLGLFVTFLILVGKHRWQSEVEQLREKVIASPVLDIEKIYNPEELGKLPAPVQRYFRAVLKNNQPAIVAVEIEHIGTFNMGEKEDNWKPFFSSQHVTIQYPNFIWDACIHMAPLLNVNVYDAYLSGEGLLTAKLLGLITVMKIPGTPQLAQGELMRFLAEAVWYPTALLPGDNLKWDAIDDSSASATFSDGSITAMLVFQFNSEGLVSSVRSEGRSRMVKSVPLATPWQGRFWNYQSRHGILLPICGEVAWMTENGAKPYWRGEIQRIEFDFSN